MTPGVRPRCARPPSRVRPHLAVRRAHASPLSLFPNPARPRRPRPGLAAARPLPRVRLHLCSLHAALRVPCPRALRCSPQRHRLRRRRSSAPSRSRTASAAVRPCAACARPCPCLRPPRRPPRPLPRPVLSPISPSSAQPRPASPRLAALGSVGGPSRTGASAGAADAVPPTPLALAPGSGTALHWPTPFAFRVRPCPQAPAACLQAPAACSQAPAA